jgi:hypothetical protein
LQQQADKTATIKVLEILAEMQNTASLQIKNYQWEEGGERERELVTT